MHKKHITHKMYCKLLLEIKWPKEDILILNSRTFKTYYSGMSKWSVVCTLQIQSSCIQTENESLTPSAGHCHYYQHLNEQVHEKKASFWSDF